MRRQQHGTLLPKLPDHRVRLADLVRVEADRRLVQDQDRRSRQQRVRQPHPLAIPARQRSDDLGTPIAQAGARDRVVDGGAPLVARDRLAAPPGKRGTPSPASRAAAAPPRAGNRARAARRACPPRSSSLPARPSPRVGVRKQLRIRISVVFPAPFGPSSPTISPRSTSNETSSSAGERDRSGRTPYRFVTARTLIKPEGNRTQNARLGLSRTSRASSAARASDYSRPRSRRDPSSSPRRWPTSCSSVRVMAWSSSGARRGRSAAGCDDRARSCARLRRTAVARAGARQRRAPLSVAGAAERRLRAPLARARPPASGRRAVVVVERQAPEQPQDRRRQRRLLGDQISRCPAGRPPRP